MRPDMSLLFEPMLSRSLCKIGGRQRLHIQTKTVRHLFDSLLVNTGAGALQRCLR